MSTPITNTSVVQFQPYCGVADVMNLIGQVITNAAFASGGIASFINEAVQYMDRETNSFFSPRRLVERYDGNGASRMNLRNTNVMAVNEVDVFFTYPLTLTRIANDWDLLIDRQAGYLSFPTYTASPLFAPFAFVFFKASQNVNVDAWYGFNKTTYGEVLSNPSGDNKTYTFANPTAFRQTLQGSYPYQFAQPPSFVPNIYSNGTLLTNTSYVLSTSALATANNQWQINQDNLIYTYTTSASGITGVVFNTPNANGTVVTADYAYWYIPADVQIATAKRAAINILGAIGNGLFGNNQFNGVDELMIDGARIQTASGAFGSVIARWQADINEVIARYRVTPLDYSGGYDPSVSGGLWF